MTREQYEAERQKLYNEGMKLINEGKITEAEAITERIQALDREFEQGARAEANLNALMRENEPANLETASRRNITGQVADRVGSVEDENGDPLGSLEYRKAFMNYLLRGTAIPENLRNEAGPSKTGDAGELIPTTILSIIQEKIEKTGNILPLVTKTHYKGGVKIPLSTVKPVASWVAEGAGSEIQKKKITGYISFGYNKLRCAVSVTLEVDVMALEVFERKIAENIAEAMVKAQEDSIFNGNGVGQPKGILTETVPEGQTIDITVKDGINYTTLIDAEAALPEEYETGAKWFMTKKTFMKFVGMVDADGQPIARINYGIGGKPERILLGREVITNTYMKSFTETSAEGEIPAILFNMSDYVLNSNLNVTVKTYEDNETEDKVTKAIMLVDGKAVDVNSLVVLKVKAAA